MERRYTSDVGRSGGFEFEKRVFCQKLVDYYQYNKFNFSLHEFGYHLHHNSSLDSWVLSNGPNPILPFSSFQFSVGGDVPFENLGYAWGVVADYCMQRGFSAECVTLAYCTTSIVNAVTSGDFQLLRQESPRSGPITIHCNQGQFINRFVDEINLAFIERRLMEQSRDWSRYDLFNLALRCLYDLDKPAMSLRKCFYSLDYSNESGGLWNLHPLNRSSRHPNPNMDHPYKFHVNVATENVSIAWAYYAMQYRFTAKCFMKKVIISARNKASLFLDMQQARKPITIYDNSERPIPWEMLRKIDRDLRSCNIMPVELPEYDARLRGSQYISYRPSAFDRNTPYQSTANDRGYQSF